MKSRGLAFGFLVALAATLAAPAAGQTVHYLVLLDLDGNPATGCTVTEPGGPAIFGGADQRLTITVDFTVAPGSITSETRAVCIGGVFGPELAVSAGGWPVGAGNGPGGEDVIEGFVPIGALGTANPLRVGVVSLDSEQQGDALFPLASILEIPTLSGWSALLLVSLLTFAALIVLRRSGALPVMTVALLLTAVAAWAATIVMDGQIADWAGIAPRGSDPVGDTGGSASTDIVALFTTADAVNFYVRIDVQPTGVTGATADLALTKTVSDAAPNVGDQITFTVTLTNNGPDDATGVQVTDLLPAGLTLVSATPSQGTYTPGSGIWDLATVTVSTPQSLAIVARVDSPDARTNTATITGTPLFDPDTANNSASATETPQQADLALTKTVSDPTPNVGDQITFTVTLTNNGPDDATGVQVTDVLPTGLAIVSATPSQGTYDNLSGLWTVGTITPVTPQTLSILATVEGPDAQTNTANVSDSDQFDPNTANNSASATESPQQADLALTKTVSDATPNVGDQITFTVTLTNNGPDDATGVQVTDVLPTGLAIVSATPSQGTYDNLSGLWTVGTVTPVTPQTLSILATVEGPDAQTNTANVSDSDQFDPNTANNSASATETPQQADLALTKVVDNATPNVGDQITFTITLTNNGPDDATGVQVTDVLPAGLGFVLVTPSQGTYLVATGAWTVGSLAFQGSATLTMLVSVTVSAGGTTITNTAQITDSDVLDPDTTDNQASVQVTVPSPP